MSCRAVGAAFGVLAWLLLAVAGPASAEPADPDGQGVELGTDPRDPIIPLPLPGQFGFGPSNPQVQLGSIGECKEAPTPDTPGQGIGGFFSTAPSPLPPEGDPFAKGSSTTIYEQYGFAGLRWHTYDLGCGPDMMRQPDAVIGTSMSNWMVQAPIALTGLTASVTKVAFNPTFLGVFDPAMSQVSTVLHESLFVSWAPLIIALLGILIIVRANKQSLSTATGSIGWAILVVLVATALFRWPVAAGQAADATVGNTLGAVAAKLSGHEDVDPGMAVASNVQEEILYRAWLAGTFGSPDSSAAKKYGEDLFKSQALTWREAQLVHDDPNAGQELIADKRAAFTEIADKIAQEDPGAYEYLIGKRSEARVGYSILGVLGTFLALPFLLISALLMLGCFLIVRLAVMMFPAFAVMGLVPATRGVVVSLGRTVGAAVVNAIIFGVGAAVTVAVLGILFHPGGGAPAWLSLVLMPLFTFVMWVALRPFRRLTSVVSSHADPFGDMAGSVGTASRASGHFVKRAVVAGGSAMVGGAAGAAASQALTDEDEPAARQRAETSAPFVPLQSQPSSAEPGSDEWDEGDQVTGNTGPQDRRAAPREGRAAQQRDRHRAAMPEAPRPRAAITGYAPMPTGAGVPPRPTEPEWVDGEDVYRIYHPDDAAPADAPAGTSGDAA